MNPKKKNNIVIIGAGKGGTALIELFKDSEAVNILGVVDVNTDAPGIRLAREIGIPVSNDYKKFINKDGLDEIINVTGLESVQKELLEARPKGVGVLGGHSARVMWRILDQYKSVTEEFRTSEEKYRILFDNAADLIIVVDTKGKFLDLNQKFTEESEYLREEMLGKNFAASGIITKESTAKALFHLGELIIKGKEPPIFEVEGVKKSGGIVNYELRAVPIKKEGKIVAIQAILRNITTRKESDKVLKESEEKFKVIFTSVIDGILLADVKTRKLTDANDVMCRMLGYSLDEIKKLGVKDVHPKESLPHVYNTFEKQIKGETLAKDLPMKRKDGSVFFADINASTVTIAGKTYLMGVFRDVTESKNMEEEMRASEILYRTIFENTGTVTAILGEDTTVAMVNAQFAKFFGYSKGEIEGKMSILEFVCKEEEEKVMNYHRLRRIDPEAAPKNYELRVMSKNRAVSETYITVAVIPETKRSVVSILDVTELKRNEFELLRQKDLLNNTNKALEHKLKELQEAVGHIKKLEGLVPICSNCKKMMMEGHDPKDSKAWVTLEKYISDRTDASFTHGLCPDCIGRMYGDMRRKK